MNKCGILILNYNSSEDTLKMVDRCHSLFGVDYRDILVVDNASPDAGGLKIKEQSKIKGFVFITSDKNGGYAYGNNLGLRYAYNENYKYIWIMNNDIVLESEHLMDELLSVFERDNSLAVVNPEVVAGDGHIYNRDALRPSFFDFTLGMINYRRKGRIIENLGGYSYIYRPQGCCMMVDLDKIHEVGYLDESTFLYCEEMILAERLMISGYKCACYLDDKIIHHNSQTVKTNLSRRKYIKTYNDSFGYYLLKYRGFGMVKTRVCKIFNTLKLFALW